MEVKLSKTKPVSVAFHLTDQEAKRELKVEINGKFLLCSPTPIYLGVKLDKTQLGLAKTWRIKLTTGVTRLRWLEGSNL